MAPVRDTSAQRISAGVYPGGAARARLHHILHMLGVTWTASRKTAPGHFPTFAKPLSLPESRRWIPRRLGRLRQIAARRPKQRWYLHIRPRTLWRVGCQHPVLAVTVGARGRDQRGQTLEQFQGREAQLRGAIGLRPGEAIDELVVGELLEPLQRMFPDP